MRMRGVGTSCEANLLRAHLEEVHLIGAHLEKVNLSEVHLEKARLENITLSDEKRIGPHMVDARSEIISCLSAAGP